MFSNLFLSLIVFLNSFITTELALFSLSIFCVNGCLIGKDDAVFEKASSSILFILLSGNSINIVCGFCWKLYRSFFLKYIFKTVMFIPWNLNCRIITTVPQYRESFWQLRKNESMQICLDI